MKIGVSLPLTAVSGDPGAIAHEAENLGFDRVTASIRESIALQDLQNKIAQQELERATQAESNALFQKLVDADRNLAGLLSNRDPTIRLPASGGKRGGESGSGEFQGKFSPTYFRLEGRYAEKGLDVPINRTRPVAGRTDAENGYLNRPDNQGKLLIPDDVRGKFSIREHLHDGRLAVFFEPIEEKVRVGDKFSFKMGLQDDSMPAPVETVKFLLNIAEEAEKPKPTEEEEERKKKTQRRAGQGDKGEGKGENAPTHGLPKCVLLTQDGREIEGYNVEQWPKDFSEIDGGSIDDYGDGQVVYKINYDNVYHIRYRTQQRGQIAKDVVTEKYILGMRILMLGYEHAFRALQEARNADGNSAGIGEFADEFRRMAARAAASTVLALAENLPKIVDASSINVEVEE